MTALVATAAHTVFDDDGYSKFFRSGSNGGSCKNIHPARGSPNYILIGCAGHP